MRAHRFVCLLAGYVEWHLRPALVPLLFDDETLHQARRTRDTVATARPHAPRSREEGTPPGSEGYPKGVDRFVSFGCRRSLSESTASDSGIGHCMPSVGSFQSSPLSCSGA